ncbi:MAG: polysaccharide biosynthesis C-terminal domain-containing protein [Actinomycetota bacterium]
MEKVSENPNGMPALTPDGSPSLDATERGNLPPARLRSRDVGITAVGNIASLLSVVIGAPILAQSLGVEQRGVVAGAVAPLMLLLGAATLGIPEAATFYIANKSDTVIRVLVRGTGLIVLVGAAASFTTILLADELANGNGQLVALIRLAALALPLALITLVLRAVAAGLHAWTLIAVERAVFGSVRLGGFLILLLIGHLNAQSATAVIAASTFLGAIAYIGLFRTRRSSITTKVDVYHKASLIRYGSRFWVGSITGVMLTRLDQVLMVPLSSESQLGLYAVAVSIAEIPLVISMAVRDVTFSVEAESSSARRITTASRITSIAVISVAAAIIGAAYPLVPIIFGREFGAATPAIIILLAGTIFATPGSIGGMAIAARGKPGLRSAALAVAAAVNAALLLALVPTYGAIGAAIATMIGNFVYTTVNLYLCSRILMTPAKDFLVLQRSDFRFILSALSRFKIKSKYETKNRERRRSR